MTDTHEPHGKCHDTGDGASTRVAPHTGARKPSASAALIKLGCAALERVLAFDAPADMALRQFFQQHSSLGRRDRGFIAETVFATLRRLRRFTALSGGQGVRRLFLVAAASLSGAGAHELGPGISEKEQQWLHALRPDRLRDTSLADDAEFPEWLCERLAKHLAEDDIRTLGQAMQEAAPLDLRVNTLLTTRAAVLAELCACGYQARAMQYSSLGLRVRGKPALERHALYMSGKIEVQDEGSQLIGALLAPRRREMVADLCAGAGGKTLLLGQLMRSEGRLYAFDVSANRVLRMRKRLARARLSNVHPEVIAHERDARLKRLAGKFDRVLVDAPCTGTGTLRRNPDLKWRQTPADLIDLSAKQASILRAAARLLKPGGYLLYATCSLLQEENDEVIDGFLSENPRFRELDCQQVLADNGIDIACGARLRLLPHVHGTDGFFGCLMQLTETPPAAS